MFVILTLSILSFAVATINKGRLAYHNYFGLTVFAPFAIAIALGGLLVGLLRWKNFR
jgi:hypothetical protein